MANTPGYVANKAEKIPNPVPRHAHPFVKRANTAGVPNSQCSNPKIYKSSSIKGPGRPNCSPLVSQKPPLAAAPYRRTTSPPTVAHSPNPRHTPLKLNCKIRQKRCIERSRSGTPGIVNSIPRNARSKPYQKPTSRSIVARMHRGNPKLGTTPKGR